MSTEEADEHPVPKKPRFAILSEDVMNSTLKDNDSENTKKATDRVPYLQMCMKEYRCCPEFKRGDNSTYTFTKRGVACTL
jgi:hypothetical protein